MFCWTQRVKTCCYSIIIFLFSSFGLGLMSCHLLKWLISLNSLAVKTALDDTIFKGQNKKRVLSSTKSYSSLHTYTYCQLLISTHNTCISFTYPFLIALMDIFEQQVIYDAHILNHSVSEVLWLYPSCPDQTSAIQWRVTLTHARQSENNAMIWHSFCSCFWHSPWLMGKSTWEHTTFGISPDNSILAAVNKHPQIRGRKRVKMCAVTNECMTA